MSLATQKRTLTSVAALASALAFGQVAGAQEHCGGSYTVRAGDTLAGIAAKCSTSVTALTRANAVIGNPDRIEIGWQLTVPEGSGSGDDSADRGGSRDSSPDYAGADGRAAYGATYEVRPGDTFAGIAAALGLSLIDVIAANEGIDPFSLRIGQQIRLPGDGRADRGDREPDDGGDRVLTGRVIDGGVCATLRTEDGDEWNLVSDRVGFTEGEYVEVRGARSQSSGCAGRTLEVAALTEVTPPDDGRDDGRDERRDEFTLEGRVTTGGTCPVLQTEDGRTYTMVSDDVRFSRGEYVEVTARHVRTNECDGRVIEVSAIDEVAPPRGSDDGRGDEDDGRQVQVEGRIASGTECPVLRTTDGDVYSLVSDDVRFTTGEYVEIQGQTVGASFCMQGTTVDVRRMREVSPPSDES